MSNIRPKITAAEIEFYKTVISQVQGARNLLMMARDCSAFMGDKDYVCDDFSGRTFTDGIIYNISGIAELLYDLECRFGHLTDDNSDSRIE